MSVRCIQQTDQSVDLEKKYIKEMLSSKKDKVTAEKSDKYINSQNTQYSYPTYHIDEVKKTYTEEEKLKNRELIDFSGNLVMANPITKIFTLYDGTKIPYEAVSDKPRKGTVKDLEVVNNCLALEYGCYYKFVDSDGFAQTFCAGKTLLSGSFTDSQKNGGIDGKPDGWSESKARKTQDIITSMLELKVPFAAYMFYSHEEVAELLQYAGIKPGKFTLSIEGIRKTTYYMGHDGDIWAEYEVESRRQAINYTNYKKYNVPQDTQWLIDGVTYPMDENGYFHIPEGAMVCPGDMKLIDPEGNEVTYRMS
ncbi:MAG: hypothetical protein PHY47_27280 [Lachnospiraceae bacterium]|nr:hypothetical protein [Lachnospiraceae bacterium]